MYWNEYNIKSESKYATNKNRYFLKSIFAVVKKLFVLIYSNQDDGAKDIKPKYIIYQQVLLRIITSSMEKTPTSNPLIQI